MHRLTRSVVPLLGIALSAPLAAQADWATDVLMPKPRAVHAAAFDIQRNQVVMFGGNTNSGAQGDTWLWSIAGGWSKANPATLPPERVEHAMAYDAARNEIVMFGGVNSGGDLGDTWLWNGTDWRVATPANSPGARRSEMAFDPVSGRVILFGGYTAAATFVNDTWGWDGTNWQQLAPTQVPLARADHCLETDWARGEIMMFGGWNQTFFADTWVWRNNDWVSMVASGPTPRSEHKMGFDGSGIVLFAGDTSTGQQQDTWRWDGMAWTQIVPATVPETREEHVMVGLRGSSSALMFGGWNPTTGHVSDTWAYAGGQWLRLTPAGPFGTGTHAMAHDPRDGTTLLVGGYQDQHLDGDTWIYKNGSWAQLFPATSPPVRAEPALAFDRVRGEFVLFGGAGASSTYYDDTWIFKNGNWQQANPLTSPPARWGHGMAFDESRGTVVLFSGRLGGASANLIDTWEWNGTNWTQLAPASTPSGREDHGLVWDASRGELLLFGGWVSGLGFVDDTWAFRSGNWVKLTPVNAPTARSEHMMACDRVRDRVVVFGGEDATGRVADTWEWDGSDWTQRSPAHAPERREEGAMVFDELSGQILMYAGWDLGHFQDTWTYATRPPATAVEFGAGCRGSAAATPALSASRPWLGEPVVYGASSLPAGSASAMVFGAVRTSIPLDPIGMPACVLLTSPIASATMVTTGTMASYTLPLPASPNLVRARLSAQAFVVAPGVNPLGIIATNAVELQPAIK